MNILTATFLFALVFTTGMRIWLAGRHARHVDLSRHQVPEEFAGIITCAEHEKAAAYCIAHQRVNRIEYVYGAILLLGWTIGGGLDLLQRLWGDLLDHPLLGGSATLVSLMLLGGVLDLPFSLYRHFVLEARFGFNRTTAGTFFADLLKAALLMMILGVPLVLLVLWLMRRGGDAWWFYAWVAWSGFNLLLMWLYPVLIAPLFNRFEPLAESDLAARLAALADRVGFRYAGVQIMDGSRRSSHANAYFTGFGNNRRIVLFDTLLQSLTPPQIEAVLAHELGHFKLNHVTRRMVWSFGLSLAGLWLLGWLARQPEFYAGLGVALPTPAAALALFALVIPVFTFPLTPLFSWASRRHEYAADQFAATHADGQALIRALVKLSKDNAATVTPDPLHSAFYDSHPPMSLRVSRLRTQAASLPP